MAQITEWEFTADVASRINRLLDAHLELPFKEARAEARKKGRTQRRDLTLYDRTGKIVLTGEVKMPDKPDGRSPFQQGVVEDAHKKADDIGVDHNFTWNVNRFVLWKTHESGKPITERYVEHFYVLPSPIHDSDDTLDSRVQSQIDAFLLQFLERFAALLSGERPMLLLPLDQKFIFVYEASLEQPVAQTLAAINQQYHHNQEFRRKLDAWMRDEQGWVLSQDEAILRDNLERAAKFSCYVLANKIVFYKALRRRYPQMRHLRIPKSYMQGSELGKHLSSLFKHAEEMTGDYESVFESGFGDTLPFLNDAAVDSWRDLSEQTDGFDFTQFSHEIIGQIFERLLSTEERHKFGQHYTRSEVVDMINAFCIRKPEARVLDPSCGGGTFLVRAYARKRALSRGALHHRDLVQQLYGFDISAYPIHLTTINLVTHDLIDEANYPLVARQDFFKVRPNATPFSIPVKGMGGQLVPTLMSKVDAVVGNPPYVRQEKINEYYGAAYKRFLQEEIAGKEAPNTAFSGRSDIHVYFFPHAAAFLEEGGYMGLLTSSTWLDTTYGFRLQKYLLDNFEIIAIIESASEPWFTGARVTTAATILRKQSDPAKRAANIVHFVKLHRELADLLANYDDEESRRRFFERMRDHIEKLEADETTDNWRVRCISQDELYKLGQLPIEVNESEEDENGSENGGPKVLHEASTQYQAASIADDYVGYKWGIFLRAPDVFFKLLKLCRDTLVPLSQIAEIRRGVTSGADDFFYPFDITTEEINRLDPRDFKEMYGIRPSDASKIRIVRAGDGSVHLVETRFLEPVVFSLMEVSRFEIDPSTLKRSVLVCSLSKRELRRQDCKCVLKYIEWGEREGFDKRPTCASRDRWYELQTGGQRGAVFWPKIQQYQYRHVIALNPHNLVCNCNLYDVSPSGTLDVQSLCAVLNSTFVALSKQFFGRYAGREGALKTEVVDIKMMLVPDVGRQPGL